MASVTKAKQFEAEAKKKNKDAYVERKNAAVSSGSEAVPYMENEYTKEHYREKEQQSLDALDALLNEE